ncbi:hypothetical protein HDF16_004904 [Granulicella aggregans]|uniref:Uncharacterized protein n=1 Tax=Granulicella aggregans TaxID=474949 RepID=A0A7W8E5J1_9BACT|nr:hypothetical protein [Granulicella aggregans]MBB5060168.1 hypothetical protein [Granulicella aggregans]
MFIKQICGKQGRDERSGNSSLRTKIIAAFITFHITVLLLFAIPIDIAPLRAARSLVAPYMRCIGMTETWDMFAPDPKSAEQFFQAIVVTKSGQYKLYSFPRMEQLPLTERYRKERYRKFGESLLCSDCSGLWPDVERAVARLYADPVDPPERVILIKYESPIDPKKGAVGDDLAAKSTILGGVRVQPEDLQ